MGFLVASRRAAFSFLAFLIFGGSLRAGIEEMYLDSLGTEEAQHPSSAAVYHTSALLFFLSVHLDETTSR